jgi:glucose/arabinose dehydrogenase
MFVGQHGSRNRQPHRGYKVISVPFKSGKPAGQPLDVLASGTLAPPAPLPNPTAKP